VNNNGTDPVTGRLTGLGNGDVLITVDASAAVLEACANRGGNFPSDPKKQTTIADVAASGLFPGTKNGNLSFTVTLAPPNTGLTCPGGQVVVFVCVEYADKTVTVEQPPGTGVVGPTPTTPSSAFLIRDPAFTAECQALFDMNP
jgi:hypothetical protein